MTSGPVVGELVSVRGRLATTELEVGQVVDVTYTPRVQVMIDAGRWELVRVNNTAGQVPAGQLFPVDALEECPCRYCTGGGGEDDDQS